MGLNFVLFLGAIQSIPNELYEAADLDGAIMAADPEAERTALSSLETWRGQRDQTEVDEAHAMASTLYADGSALRVKLTSADGSGGYVLNPELLPF